MKILYFFVLKRRLNLQYQYSYLHHDTVPCKALGDTLSIINYICIYIRFWSKYFWASWRKIMSCIFPLCGWIACAFVLFLFLFFLSLFVLSPDPSLAGIAVTVTRHFWATLFRKKLASNTEMKRVSDLHSLQELFQLLAFSFIVLLCAVCTCTRGYCTFSQHISFGQFIHWSHRLHLQSIYSPFSSSLH